MRSLIQYIKSKFKKEECNHRYIVRYSGNMKYEQCMKCKKKKIV